jgi:molecular chaperone HtpG
MDKTAKAEVKKFDAEVGKVLRLMIHSLYTNKDIFLRELISNASDACDKLRYQAIDKPELLGQKELKIDVIIDKDAGTVTVRDNGIGMDKKDLINNLGTIASSGTQKFMEQLKDKPNETSLIGQFGVGFYSAFMVSDEITVTSTKAGSKTTYVWQSNGQDDYSIAKSETTHPAGTSITLKLRASEVEFLEKYRLRHIITTYSDHISFPIELHDGEGNSEIVNSASALWTRPKSEITDEQYEEFYHHVAHQPGNPWLRIHNKVEGSSEFTSLLYIPSNKPYDLFHPDRKNRVKLYVKRVFITDEGVNLVPSYLRFLRGVIDSEDLPLNISRETLQNNSMIDKIRKAVVRKVLSELKTKLTEDAKSYDTFWNNFGEVMKEGLCEGSPEDKEQILDVCKFYSTSSDEPTSLEDYISRMPETQDKIFYITGDNPESLKKHPQLEGFKKRGIEVLLLSDHVDDFWVQVATDYKKKEFVSINSSDIDLDDIKKLEKDEENKPKENKELLGYIKKILGEQVKEVRVSTKLVDSPACIAVPHGAMSSRMEKYLIDQKQLKVASAKILEVNTSHPILIKIAKELESGNSASHTEDLVNIIFDQACVLEGENLKDPQGFVTRLNKLLSDKVAA